MLTTFVAAVLAWSAAVHAGEVRLRYESTDVYAGVPFTVAIKVVAEDSHDPPQFPAIEGADVAAAGQQSSTNSSFRITINGRRVGTSTATTEYYYRITPQRAGRLQIPAIEIRADGKTLRTKPVEFRVIKAETGDLMHLELVASKDSVYVGEPVDLRLRIWLRPYARGREVLDQNDMWNMIDHQASNWGSFVDLIQQRRPQVTVRKADRPGVDGVTRTYYVYELKKRVWPERAGPLEVGNVRVVVSYPLKVTRDRGFFFSGPRVTQAKPIAAAVEETPVMVKPIPAEGRPPYYRGAVGPHLIHVSAKPVEARVGDPITLNLTVTGQGRLDLLQAPPLADLPEFSEHFQVSEDQLPGMVEQNRKRFTQSIRALTDEIAEIPPIPLAYFDTDREEFVTVYSDPIPIRIEAAQRMSATQIVESGDRRSPSASTLTLLQRGIESNYTDPEELLARHGFHPSTASAVLAGAGPFVYLTCVLIRRSRRRLAWDVALTRRRSARKKAVSRIRKAVAVGDSAGAAPDLMRALLGYVADRLDLPAGGLTREEALARLRAAGAADKAVERTDAVLHECETVQFGGGSASSADDLAGRVNECIDELEGLRL